MKYVSVSLMIVQCPEAPVQCIPYQVDDDKTIN